MTMTGGCLCGAVRYAASAAPLTARICWCRVCQYFAAGNGSLNAVFARDSLTITGALSRWSSLADSGNHMRRSFCPKCGVQLFSEAEERPQLIIVRAGTLDDPSRVRPEGMIWTASAPAWAYLDPKLPQFAGQPPPPLAK